MLYPEELRDIASMAECLAPLVNSNSSTIQVDWVNFQPIPLLDEAESPIGTLTVGESGEGFVFIPKENDNA